MIAIDSADMPRMFPRGLPENGNAVWVGKSAFSNADKDNATFVMVKRDPNTRGCILIAR